VPSGTTDFSDWLVTLFSANLLQDSFMAELANQVSILESVIDSSLMKTSTTNEPSCVVLLKAL